MLLAGRHATPDPNFEAVHQLTYHQFGLTYIQLVLTTEFAF